MYEAYCSATALIRQTQDKMSRNLDTVMWDMVGGDVRKVTGQTAFDAMREGDAAAREIINNYTYYLAVGIVNVINIFQPKILCIGGGICGLGGLYIVMNSAHGTGGVWVYNSISGYGWLAVAIVIFCTWSPGKAVLCSLIVGALTVIRYYYPLSFIPAAIYEIFPYIATVVVLIAIIFRKKKNNLPPSSLGLAYFREER